MARADANGMAIREHLKARMVLSSPLSREPPLWSSSTPKSTLARAPDANTSGNAAVPPQTTAGQRAGSRDAWKGMESGALWLSNIARPIVRLIDLVVRF